MEAKTTAGSVIKVLGIGGAGGNAINRMIEVGIENVEFIAINTDSQDLVKSKAHIKLDIGRELTKGLGAGADPSIGKKAAEENIDDIKSTLTGVDMVFIAAGEGGGTGTGAAPVVAKIAKELKILTIGIVTRPFSLEGPRKSTIADTGIKELKEYSDAVIVIPNDSLIQRMDKKMKIISALYHESNTVLLNSVKAIADIINRYAFMNLDFSDVRNVLLNSNTAFIGIGSAKGEGMALEATQRAISSPLVEGGIKGAYAALINFQVGEEIGMDEFSASCTAVQKMVDPEANIILGIDIRDELEGDEMVVTVIAAGFPEQSSDLTTNSNDKVIDDEKITDENDKILKTQSFNTSSDENQDEKSVSINDEQDNYLFGDIDLPDFLK